MQTAIKAYNEMVNNLLAYQQQQDVQVYITDVADSLYLQYKDEALERALVVTEDKESRNVVHSIYFDERTVQLIYLFMLDDELSIIIGARILKHTDGKVLPIRNALFEWNESLQKLEQKEIA